MSEDFSKSNLKIRNLKDKIFRYIFLSCVVFCLVFLIILLVGILAKGISRLTPGFLTSFPSLVRKSKSGIAPAIVGSLWLLVLVAVITVPVGIGAAIYLEEYADYFIALERMNDKDDRIVSAGEMRELLGLQD